MRNHRFVSGLLLLGAALSLAGAANAQSYVDIGLGPSKAELGCEGTQSCSTVDRSLQAFLGRKLTGNIAAEVGYLEYGSAQASIDGQHIALKTSGIGLGVGWMASLTPRWRLFGRMGLADVKTRYHLDDLAATRSTLQLYGGIGAGYWIASRMSLNVQYSFSRGKYRDSYRVSALTAGVAIGF